MDKKTTQFNVLADFHHAGLLNSLIMLFEGRLGGSLYRPIGTEWAEQGYWKVYDHPATIEQFLGIGGATPDGTPPLNEVVGHDRESLIANFNVYLCKDIEGDKTNKAITLETFFRMPIDIVIASIPQHIEPFKKLCEAHPNSPKLIYQIGNAWDIPNNSVQNVMASAICQPPIQINYVEYHQEFDLNTFYPVKEIGHNYEKMLTFDNKNIFSFVNVFQNFPDYDLFREVTKMMPEWDFKSYGGQCPDGSMNGTKELAHKMREARFIWHTKAGGDGYGHVLHNTAAVARPIITKKSYYAGKMGEKLMIDGETCINIDGLNPEQIVEKINFYNEPERYLAMCQATYDNFKRVVDFDKEFEDIKVFLSNLK